ncbi:MAG: TVP38/TMEM64 family protein [Chloroflexi bacterium]|nr:TVP38/TMEM64 family protein [Chloroflexota bacterium]
MLAHLSNLNSASDEKVNGRFPLILKLSSAAIGAGLLFWLRQPISDVLRIVSNRQAVIAYLDQFGALAPLLLGLVLVLQVIVATIPGHALMIGGGYVFGFVPGFWINLAATVLGSQVAFWLARTAGRPLVEKLAPVSSLNKWYAISAQKGLLFFLFAFMLPIFPADVMNYVPGLSALSPRRFFVANLFGRLPGVIVVTAVGACGFQFSPVVWVGIAVSSMSMFTLWRLVFARKS